MHNQCIGSNYKQKRQQHRYCPILRMGVNGTSTICSFALWKIYIRFIADIHFQALAAFTGKNYSDRLPAAS
jgi:hypothetical protein